jgi:hypothetical protein
MNSMQQKYTVRGICATCGQKDDLVAIYDRGRYWHVGCYTPWGDGVAFGSSGMVLRETLSPQFDEQGWRIDPFTGERLNERLERRLRHV